MPEHLHRFLVAGAAPDLDIRTARHPSESIPHLICRVLAFVLHKAPGLTFSPGVCVGGEPALFTPAINGRMALWIDIGVPGDRKLRRGLRQADRVIVYAYDRAAELGKTMAGRGLERLLVYWWERSFLERLGATLAPVVRWRLDRQGELVVVNGISGLRHQVQPPL